MKALEVFCHIGIESLPSELFEPRCQPFFHIPYPGPSVGFVEGLFWVLGAVQDERAECFLASSDRLVHASKERAPLASGQTHPHRTLSFGGGRKHG
jgi:hypothetical protein